MAEYIKRTKAMEICFDYGQHCFYQGDARGQDIADRILDDITAIPNADVVEITRCADCQHCAIEYEDQGFGYPSRPTRVCIIHDHETKLDDYCSWAKRKDEGK